METPKLKYMADPFSPRDKHESEMATCEKKEKILEERRRRERERTRLLRANETPEEATIRREKSALRARKNRALKKLKSQLTTFIEDGSGAQDVIKTLINVEDIEHTLSRENAAIDSEDNASSDYKPEIMDCFELNKENEVQDYMKEKCPECQTVILRRSLYRHLKTVHKYSDELVAEFKQNIQMRIKNMTKPKYCISCHEHFPNELQLQSHMKLMHAKKLIKKEPEENEKLTIPEKVITSYINLIKQPKENDCFKSFPNGVIPTVPIDDVILNILNWPVNVEV